MPNLGLPELLMIVVGLGSPALFVGGIVFLVVKLVNRRQR